MIEYNLPNFYLAAKDIVQHQKATRECDRINSMVVVNRKFDIDKDYIQERERSPYYFSRDTTKILYPALIFSENYDTLGNIKNGKYVRDCHIIEMGVVDQLIENCDDCGSCGKRDIEEIKHGAIRLLKSMVKQLAQLQLYKLQPDDVYKYSVQPLIDQYISEGHYTDYDIVRRETALISKVFRETNDSKKTFPYDNAAKRLYGGFVTLTICENCSGESMQFKIKTIEKEKLC